MPQPLHIIRWLITALGFGMAVVVITFFVAWRQVDSHPNFRFRERTTLEFIHATQTGVENFRKENGHLPVTLRDLHGANVTEYDLIINDAGDPIDYWGNPLLYISDEKNLKILSYGEDKKPGGTGSNQDLSSDDSTLPPIPLSDFLRSQFAPIAIENSFKAGGFATLVFLITVWPNQFITGFKLPWIRMLVTSIFTVLIAGFITVVQLSGH